jgi:hypothetical protein
MARTAWRAAAPPRTRDPSRGSTLRRQSVRPVSRRPSAVPPGTRQKGTSIWIAGAFILDTGPQSFPVVIQRGLLRMKDETGRESGRGGMRSGQGVPKLGDAWVLPETGVAINGRRCQIGSADRCDDRIPGWRCICWPPMSFTIICSSNRSHSSSLSSSTPEPPGRPLKFSARRSDYGKEQVAKTRH